MIISRNLVIISRDLVIIANVESRQIMTRTREIITISRDYFFFWMAIMCFRKWLTRGDIYPPPGHNVMELWLFYIVLSRELGQFLLMRGPKTRLRYISVMLTWNLSLTLHCLVMVNRNWKYTHWNWSRTYLEYWMHQCIIWLVCAII